MIPEFTKFVRIVKMILNHHGMRNPYRGGMSGHCITLLAVHSAQSRWRMEKVNNLEACGVDILYFFKLYGYYNSFSGYLLNCLRKEYMEEE
jgi:DNA polymerase sigma